MTNIDLFNKHAGTALTLLYDSFPSPIDISPMQLVNSAWTEGDSIEDADADELRRAMDCLAWLNTHGYFHGHYLMDGMFSSSVLTPKALDALNRSPASLEGREPLGQRVKAVLKGAGKEISKQTLSELIKQVLG